MNKSNRAPIETKAQAHELLREEGHVTYSYRIAEEGTEDLGDLFMVHLVHKRALEGSDPFNDEVGAGPTFVVKETGEVFVAGSAYGYDYYVKAWRETGDPHAELSNEVKITSIPVDADPSHLATLLAFATIHQERPDADKEAARILSGEVITVRVILFRQMQFVDELHKLGFGAELIWNTFADVAALVDEDILDAAFEFDPEDDELILEDPNEDQLD